MEQNKCGQAAYLWKLGFLRYDDYELPIASIWSFLGDFGSFDSLIP